jgi:hypothetical protein
MSEFEGQNSELPSVNNSELYRTWNRWQLSTEPCPVSIPAGNVIGGYKAAINNDK